jgi:hypothetical protein
MAQAELSWEESCGHTYNSGLVQTIVHIQRGWKGIGVYFSDSSSWENI